VGVGTANADGTQPVSLKLLVSLLAVISMERDATTPAPIPDGSYITLSKEDMRNIRERIKSHGWGRHIRVERY